MTVIPLFCSRFLKAVPHGAGHALDEGQIGVERRRSWWDRFNAGFNRKFNRLLDFYERWVRRAVQRPGLTVAVLSGVFVLSLAIYPLLGLAFFPQTDAGQFTINLKVPTGTRIEVTEQYVARVEDLIRHSIDAKDLKMVVSNLGVVPDFSSLYTTNAGPYTATIQVALQDGHRQSSFAYMDEVQKEMAKQFPDVRTFFSSGSMVDAVLNMGMPAPIDVQVSSPDLQQIYGVAQDLASQIRSLRGVGEVYVPQDLNYPALRLDVDRVHAGELGLTQKDVVDNVITALNSNYMIAPNYWVDHKSGNDYYLTVQYFEKGRAAIHNMVDLGQIPLRAQTSSKLDFSCGPAQVNPVSFKLGRAPDQRPAWVCGQAMPDSRRPHPPESAAPVRPVTFLNNVVTAKFVQTPTEVDHYQIQRTIDIYVTPQGEDLQRVTSKIRDLVDKAKVPGNVRINLRGMVNGMDQSFKSFAFGFVISFILLFLILTAQFKSFIDPFLIMLAIPMGFVGVLIILPLTGATLNVMSLMGVLMLVGIIGMIPMALKLGTGAEQYAPMAKAIIGGLTSSVLLTIFIVPAAYLLVYGKKNQPPTTEGPAEAAV
jgi:multidrug efflux pump subunit AcrB